MPWWAQQGTGATGSLKKSATAPGANWVQVPGATDSMTAQQAAQKLADDVVAGTFGTSVAGGVAKAAGAAGISNPFSSVENALSGFYDVLTNGKMWRSLGWLVLGVVLMIIGVAVLVGGKALGVAKNLPIPLPV